MKDRVASNTTPRCLKLCTEVICPKGVLNWTVGGKFSVLKEDHFGLIIEGGFIFEAPFVNGFRNFRDDYLVG